MCQGCAHPFSAVPGRRGRPCGRHLPSHHLEALPRRTSLPIPRPSQPRGQRLRPRGPIRQQGACPTRRHGRRTGHRPSQGAWVGLRVEASSCRRVLPHHPIWAQPSDGPALRQQSWDSRTACTPAATRSCRCHSCRRTSHRREHLHGREHSGRRHRHRHPWAVRPHRRESCHVVVHAVRPVHRARRI